MAKFQIQFRTVWAIILSSTVARAFAAPQLQAIHGSPSVVGYERSDRIIGPSQGIHIVVSLAHIDAAGSEAFVESLNDPRSPNFQRWISQAEFGAKFGAPLADTTAISDYLSAKGFTNVVVHDNRLFVSADATAHEVEDAFHTTFASFVRPPHLVAKGEPETFFAPVSPPELPIQLASRVSAVHGLSDLLLQHPVGPRSALLANSQALFPNPMAVAEGYDPASISKLYNTDAIFAAGPNGFGMSIGVYSPTQRVSSDPDNFAARFGITGYTITDDVIGSGPADSSGLTEAALDIEMIIGQAQKSHVYLLEPAATTSGEIEAFTAAGNLKLPVLSSSWGFEEDDVIDAGVLSFANDFDNLCKSLAASGMSIFVAAGDHGAFDDRTTPQVSNIMEASCPHTAAVGGTHLLMNTDGSYKTESYWTYNSSTNLGGGGGISRIYDRPSWQTGPGVSNSFSNGKRQVPDISANADPNTPYAIFDNGSWDSVGGTSASAPLWAANTLLMLQEYRVLTKKSTYAVGLVSPALYWLGTQFETGSKIYPTMFYQYHDITTGGTNGVQPVTATWDFCTGWGSCDFDKLMLDMGFYFKVPSLAPDYDPYNPHKVSGFSAWTSPMMIHRYKSSVAEPTSFVHGVAYFVDVCLLNHGRADALKANNVLFIDDRLVKTYDLRALPPAKFAVTTNQFSTTFTAGAHTLKFVANNGNLFGETSTINNTYTRTITVN